MGRRDERGFMYRYGLVVIDGPRRPVPWIGGLHYPVRRISSAGKPSGRSMWLDERKVVRKAKRETVYRWTNPSLSDTPSPLGRKGIRTGRLLLIGMIGWIVWKSRSNV